MFVHVLLVATYERAQIPWDQQLQDASSGFSEHNPDPLEEKQVLFTIQQSFPIHSFILLFKVLNALELFT